MQQGDTWFFYHTKSAKQQVTRLYKDVEQVHGLPRNEQLKISQLLESAVEQANRYSGTIFGYAEALGPAEYSEEQGGHFKTRFFAPLSRVHIFDYPLAYDGFRDFVQISQGPITRLHRPQFERIKELLTADQNELPASLQNAVAAETECPDVNQGNWPSISCVESTRFVDEAHLRFCLLDYLLEELKDSGTPLLRECRCPPRRGKQGKIADYFVKIHNNWIPVEAKLNILSEPDVLGQVAQYTRAFTFKPTQGIHKGEEFRRKTWPPDVCLIVDQSGVYIASSREFLDCSPGEPVWRREELDHSLAPIIRDRIREGGER
jgi:hypothetical protein